MALGEPADQPPARSISERHRDAVIRALREAAGEGLIDLDEFGDRAGAVYAAADTDELRAALRDVGPVELPADDVSAAVAAIEPPTPAPPPPAAESQLVLAVMSGTERKGNWRAQGRINAVAIMGGCRLDFRNAELSAPVTHVTAFALMGGIEIVVPEGVPVAVEGFVLMGGLEDRTRPARTSGAPMLVVRASGMWGGVTVRNPRKRHRDRDRRTGREGLPGAGPSPPGTTTLLFTDVVGSTPMAESLGDQRWLEAMREHNELLRSHFERCGGREVKAQGDGFMVAFPSARSALLCAVEIQQALAEHRVLNPDRPLHVRMGLHSGEVVAEDDDLFGRNVIVASRIATCAGPDQILTSALTKQLAESGNGLHFGDEQTVELRGLSGRWHLHEVRW